MDDEALQYYRVALKTNQDIHACEEQHRQEILADLEADRDDPVLVRSHQVRLLLIEAQLRRSQHVIDHCTANLNPSPVTVILESKKQGFNVSLLSTTP